MPASLDKMDGLDEKAWKKELTKAINAGVLPSVSAYFSQRMIRENLPTGLIVYVPTFTSHAHVYTKGANNFGISWERSVILYI
jgi:hypothetical protein